MKREAHCNSKSAHTMVVREHRWARVSFTNSLQPLRCCGARRTGRLTAEERAARLAEMAGNAGVHEEARWSRLRNAKAADAAEEAAAEAALQARTLADTVHFCQPPEASNVPLQHDHVT